MRRFLGICGGILLAGSLNASTILFDSTQQPPDLSGGTSIDAWAPQGLYAEFSTGAYTGVLNDVAVLLYGDPTAAGAVAVDFCLNSSSPAGSNSPVSCSALGSANYTRGTLSEDTPTLIDVQFANPLAAPTLLAGKSYWIQLTTSDQSIAWSFTDDYADGTDVSCPPGQGTGCEFFQLGDTPPQPNTDGPLQLRVEIQPGSTGTTSTPEPDSFFLGFSAFAVAALFRRRNRSVRLPL
jgi:hypothetical protein